MGVPNDAADAMNDCPQPEVLTGRGGDDCRRRDQHREIQDGRQPRQFSRHEVEGVGIFLTHGVVDGLTTAAAAQTLGASAEANPIVHWLLSQGIGFTVLVMVVVAGLVGLAYPRLAAWAEFPHWFAPLLIAIGVLAGVGNLMAVVLA